MLRVSHKANNKLWIAENVRGGSLELLDKMATEGPCEKETLKRNRREDCVDI